jgi:hypothetical protein
MLYAEDVGGPGQAPTMYLIKIKNIQYIGLIVHTLAVNTYVTVEILCALLMYQI